MYFNARSIRNRFEDIKLIIEETDVDIVTITETWLVSDIMNSELYLNGYCTIRKDRNDIMKKRGGGVILFIKRMT